MQRLEAKQFDELLAVLRADGYTVVGPRIRDHAIIYAEIDSAKDLPQGWTEEQEAGTYRLKRREDSAYFGFAASPHSWKQFLFPPKERLFRATKSKDGEVSFTSETMKPEKLAFLGVRACDLAAIKIQDRVFIEGKVQDPAYKARRENVLLVAVQCAASAPTCFCVSMNTGPEATSGFDLVLTEIVTDQRLGEHSKEEHCFLIQSGSQEGERLLNCLGQKTQLSTANAENQARARAQIEEAARSQQRAIDHLGVKDLLFRNFENPRWDEVASRCLNCANCTLVCPTCFCSTVEDTSDLKGEHAERWRRWDSCFTLDHSHLHGGSVRSSAKSRYRQWLTHKLSTWWDQFETSGCVGCGRCVTWCPVGIDITEEVKAIANSDRIQ